MKRPKPVGAALPRCVLDSGGVTALVGRSRRAREWLRWIILHGGDVIVPTPVLAECTTGQASTDAEVNRVLGVLNQFGSALRAPDESTARLAGALRHAARSDDGIDALVAAEAARNPSPSVVLTSEPKDLTRLLARHTQVVVRRV